MECSFLFLINSFLAAATKIHYLFLKIITLLRMQLPFCFSHLEKFPKWDVFHFKLMLFLPDRKYFLLLIKIISTRYLLISLITRKYQVDMVLINPFRSGMGFFFLGDFDTFLLLFFVNHIYGVHLPIYTLLSTAFEYTVCSLIEYQNRTH
jgi:hypothetical protein